MTVDDILRALPQAEGAFAPCYAFSLHKSGSTLLHRMIAGVLERCGLPGVSLPDAFFNHGIFEDVWQKDKSLLPAFDRRLLYHGFRNFPQIFAEPTFRLREKRFVLLVRDPRDALVSEYFSYGRKSGSHALPAHDPDAYLTRLAAQPSFEIDQYVTQGQFNLRNKLADYRDNLNFDLGLVRRYEDVYYDKHSFLREIFEHFGIGVPADIIAEVARQNDIRPKVENEARHIRKGTPGDHMQKLQPQTIATLNDTFRDVAAFYGYAL